MDFQIDSVRKTTGQLIQINWFNIAATRSSGNTFSQMELSRNETN